MIRIVVGGQLAKDEIVAAVQKCGGDQVQVTKKGDMQAAMDIKSGAADFYLGSCQTGGGGSLAMASALCGYNDCLTVASSGHVMSDAEIADAVRSGKRCFGFVVESVDSVVPVLVRTMLEKKNGTEG